MKLLKKLLCLLSVVSILTLATGCKTVVTDSPTGGSVTNKVVDASAIIPVIHAVVPVAVQVAVNKNTNAVPYFQAASVVLDALVSGGVTDPAKVTSALASLKINNADATLAIQAGLSIYKSFASEAVTAQLTQNDLVKVLSAFNDSIKQGLAFSAGGSGGVSVSVKVAR